MMSESEQALPPPNYDDEIDLHDLFRTIWEGKWLIGGMTFAAAVIAVIIALMLPNIYRAEALLAPNGREGVSGLSGLAAQYGGLASLAGINVGSASVDKTAMGLEVLQSRKFISEFIARHDILVPLMAAKGWNSESGELRIDADVYDVASKKWVRKVSSSDSETPSMQKAYKEFREILSVTRDKKNGFVKIAIEHFSPTISKDWVDWLIEDINATIMRQDVTEAEQSIAYLNEQIKSTSLADLRSVFFSLIEEQTKTVMLASVSNEYLLKTVDPAVAPELRARPKRSLIVLLATFLGGFLGVVVQLVRANGRTRSAV